MGGALPALYGSYAHENSIVLKCRRTGMSEIAGMDTAGVENERGYCRGR